jgi:chromosome segregation ATPase
MNSKAPVVILIILCLGLLAGLVVRHNKAENEKRTNAEKIRQLSSEWATARSKLEDLEAVNTGLRTDRDTTKANLERASTQLTETKDSLTQVERKVEEATKALQDKALEIARLEARAKELEGQNTELDKQAADMKGAIGSLETRIADTQMRLSTAEGDREYLLGELLRLQTEKGNLERRLNDVVALKEQIQKLRDELSVSKRMENLRKSLYGEGPRKGGEVLQRGVRRPAGDAKPDLEVEVRRDGSATLVTPLPAGEKK